MILTEQGVKELEKELNELINVKRPQIIKLVKEAREQGDLSENADYDAAKNEQSQIESRINAIKNILNDVEVLEGSRSEDRVVKIGSKVTIHFNDNKEDETYTIVGEIESDPLEGKISNLSPVAKVILGKTVGEEVQVLGVDKPYKIKIVSIK